MSQRAITSFFTKGPPPVKISPKVSPKKGESEDTVRNSKEPSSSSEADSPEKVTKATGKRRWNRLQSDSEDSSDAVSKSPASPEKRVSKRLKNGDTPNEEVSSPKANGVSPKKTATEPKTNGTSTMEKKEILRKVGNIDLLGGHSLHPGIAKKISDLQAKNKVQESSKSNRQESASDSKSECINNESTDISAPSSEGLADLKTCVPENEIDLKSINVEGVNENGSASPNKEDKDEKASSLDDSAVTENDEDQDKSEDEAKGKGNAAKEGKEKSPAKKDVSSFFAPRKAAVSTKSKKESPKEKKGAKKSKTEDEEKESKPKSGDRQLDYDPTKKNYHPIDDACWNRGDKVPYIALARTLEEIEAISARLKIVEILSNYLRSVIVLSPDDLLPSIYLCLNQLAPAYEGLELGVAETGLMKAIAQSTGRSMAQVKADAKATGDLGIVAEQSKSTQRMMFQPARLTVKLVFEKLKEIAQMSGHASMAKKVDKIQSMFVACRNSEARYLIRSLAGKLRIGLAEQSVLQAIAQACAMTPPNQSFPPEVLNAAKGLSDEKFKALVEKAALIIKTTYCECPNYNKIVPVLLEEGVDALPRHCRLTPSIPLKPMLAHPTKGVQEVLQRFDGLKFTCEFKYDGERAQIHLSEDKTVSIYSRNQENNTTKYPDVIGRMSKAVGPNVTSCILDCEAVAWDKEKKQILPFQVLSTRKRKDANEADIKVAVCVFMFDLLYLNGKPLVRETLMERRQLLKDNFIETEGEFIFATSIDTTIMDEVQDFLEEAIKGNCEGLMVKTLESEATYEIAKRSRNWLKLKKDYLEGCGDTLDVVVLGGYLGRGKRTGTYGGFLLACYDPDNEEYQSLCKIGTGFSDESLAQHSEFFKPHVIPSARPYYRYDASHEPDHWFDAVQVWEIKCADLSLSPVHKAAFGIVDNEKGISLRFPRFLRVRDDKSVEDATSSAQVAEFYNSQDQVKNQQGTSKATEEDFY